MGIVGPNGSGKSTLIKSVLGLKKPLAGNALFFGQPLSAVRKKVGYMPQHTSVDWDFPITVADVVSMGAYGDVKLLHRLSSLHKRRIADAMSATDITEFAGRQIGQLSGGQRQRVFLARTLAQEPDLYFMDEPFQGVDEMSKQAIVSVMHKLRSEGKTTILVHHDLGTVPTYCDEVTLLNRSIIASGPVDEVFNIENVQETYGVSGSFL